MSPDFPAGAGKEGRIGELEGKARPAQAGGSPVKIIGGRFGRVSL